MTREELIRQIEARLKARQPEAAAPKPAGDDFPAFPSPAELEEWRRTNDKSGGVIDALTQGATMGFGDELTALEGAALGRTPDGGIFDYSRPFGERRTAILAAERAQQDQFAEDNPVLAGGAEVAGALATGVGAGRAGLTLMRPGMSTAANVGRGAAEGAVYGGLYGAGEADGEDMAAGAIRGAAIGGVTGGAASGVLGQLGKIGAATRASRAAPTSDALKREGGALINRAAEVNPSFEGFDDFAMQVYRHLDDPVNGFDGGSPAFVNLRRWLDGMEELSTGGTAPTLQQLRMLRGRLGPALANMQNPSEKRLAQQIKGALDGYMDAAAARNVGEGVPAVAGEGAGDATATAWRDLQEGRRLYSRGKKGELLDRMVEMAEDRAGSTYSGGNVENAIRQNFRRILDNDRLRRQFSPEEVAAIRRVVRGEPIQNVMRGLGSMSPLRGGLMSLMVTGGTGAGLSTLGPVAAVPAGVAAVADALAKAGTRSQAAAVSAMARGGMADPLQVTLSPAMQDIVRLLSAQGGRQSEALTGR